jgi:N6-adenosine-specific RNA methylase IME4
MARNLRKLLAGTEVAEFTPPGVPGGFASSTELLLNTVLAAWKDGSPAESETDVREWASYGMALGQADRRVRWEIGDWWNRGERYGERVDIVSHPDWKGPSYGTCRTYGSIAAKFDLSTRMYNLDFEHHRQVAKIPADNAIRILRDASAQATETGKVPPARQLGQQAKKEKRATREEELDEAAQRQSSRLGTKVYPVILADPPWRFKVWGEKTGMDRAADNHYPTMALEDICTLQVPAADDCVLFLWRTGSTSRKAHQVIDAWGFECKSEFVWGKDRIGNGYWVRDKHEVLMIATRGNPPAPAPGENHDSLQLLPKGKHSAKPERFYEIIEKWFPSCDKLEMFARAPRDGWDSWGNEL